MSPIGATEALAEFASTIDVGSGPAALRQYAIRAIIDTVAVAKAARDEEAFQIVASTFGSDTEGESTIWATGRRSSAANAALLNGTAAHALDYDDVAEAIHTHPSAVMVPALLNVAESIGASGREIIDAWVVGYEVQTAVGAGMDLDQHFGRGWHGTTSIAVLGGAAAVGRLLKLDTTAIRHAIAISASMAGGSRQNFGTTTKPFHAGLAARDSVLAAQLARDGLEGDLDQVEGPLGYLTNFGDGPGGNDAVVKAISDPWLLLRTPLDIKPYPCCYRAARTADASIRLHEMLGADAAGVESALIVMEPRGTAPLIHHRPQAGLQGKFSAEYVLAAGLLDGRISLETFTDVAVKRPEAQALLERVQVKEAAVPPSGEAKWEDGFADVTLSMKDGTSRHVRVDVPHGHDHDPLTDDEVDQKMRECLAFVEQGAHADSLIAQLRSLDDDQPYRGLCDTA